MRLSQPRRPSNMSALQTRFWWVLSRRFRWYKEWNESKWLISYSRYGVYMMHKWQSFIVTKMHPSKRDIMETSCKLGGNFKSTERFVVFDKYSNAKCRRSCIQNRNCEGILFRRYHKTFISTIGNLLTSLDHEHCLSRWVLAILELFDIENISRLQTLHWSS